VFDAEVPWLALIGVANACSSQATVIVVHEVTSRLRDVTASVLKPPRLSVMIRPRGHANDHR
jgi:hypothetical protein